MQSETSTVDTILAPDLALVNGRVITVDNDFTVAQAIAVKNGRVVAVGSNAEVKELLGRKTTLLDLKGKTVLPGINDSHLHLSMWATMRPPLTLDVSYPTVKSIGDVVEMVGKKAQSAPAGEWIRGYGWDETYLAEWQQDHNRRPTRWDLDPVSPDNPVCLSDFTGGHIVWANSRALELAGVTRDTPDPAGGNIIRHPATGEPTGIFNEPAASALVLALLPPFTAAQLREGILASMTELNAIGITSVTEPGLGPFELAGLDAAQALAVLNDLHFEGRLTVRIGVLLTFAHFLGQGNLGLKGLREYMTALPARTGFGDDWLRIAGIKLASDSMPPNKTAWMHDDYPGGGNGRLVVAGDTDQERYDELVSMIVYASQHRYQVGVHSTGDRAIDACVDGFVKALREDPWDARHYVIHGDFTTPACAQRLAQYNLGVSVNSLIKWTIADAQVAVVGEQMAAYEWPLRTLLDAGVHVANASDAPVTYPDWKLAVEAAVTRESKSSGKVSGADQCISRQEAIRTYTTGGAWLDHMEHVKGSIEAGKLADLCVLDQDILSVDVHDIHKIATLMTIVGGKIVHEAAPGLFR